MKIHNRINIWLVALVLFLQPAVILCDSPEESHKITVTLVSLLDPDSQIEPAIKKAILNNEPDLALSIFRDHIIMKLRAADFGQFQWHGYKLHARQKALADYLVGRLSAEDYLSNSVGGNIDFWDVYGIAGPPGAERTINWTQEAIYPPGSIDYADFRFAIPLAARYWETRVEVFIRKWFDIAAGFARDQKNSVDLLEPEKIKDYFGGWTRHSGQMLALGWRAQNIIRCMAIFAKNLPGDAAVKVWDNALEPIQSPLIDGSADIIPAGEFADIAISLVRDYPSLLLEKYEKSGTCPPNQRRSGLMALEMIVQVFGDFKAVRDISSRLAAAWQDYSDATFFPDGGMLEQSLNYNNGDAEQLEMMFAMMGSQDPDQLISLRRKVENFRRQEDALKMPGGAGFPQIGNNHATHLVVGKGAVSNDKRLLPDFTSIAFPFSGYYVMRDGWAAGDLYLFFNGARPAAGHRMRDRNSIQIFAFGRLLLSCSGSPDYYGKLPKDVLSYLSEDSSWKANTILVDGKSQTSAFGIAERAEKSPIPSRWASYEDFDFAESVHDGGYGEPFNKFKKVQNNIFTDVEHRREVLFVRPGKLWIVTDRIQNKSGVEHSYTQVWHFPPPPDGFKEEEVIVDEKALRINTEEPDQPNLWIYQAGIPDLKYEKFFGSDKPCFGWHACGIGKAVPAAEVHADWRSSGNENLVSVIIPSEGASSPVATFSRDISDGKIGFTMELKDGSKLAYQVSEGMKPISIAGIQAEATALVIFEDKRGEFSGVVIGCRAIKIGVVAQAIPGTDFFFKANENRIYNVQPFYAPTGFQWDDSLNGLKPNYKGINAE